MTPTTVYFILLGAILLAVVGVVAWANRGRAGTPSRPKGSPATKAGPATRGAKSPKPPKPPKPAAQGAVERKFLAAKRKFSKAIDRRILRESAVGEALRRNRDMVLGWYDQKGRVSAMHYHARDPRVSCKVCQGRNGKEFPLLKPEVIAQVLPPNHLDGGGKSACGCHVSPVLTHT